MKQLRVAIYNYKNSLNAVNASFDELLDAIDTSYETSYQLAFICGCLEPDEDGNPSCEPLCISCKIMERNYMLDPPD